MKFFSESPSPEPLIPLDVPVKLKQTSKRHHTEETKVKKTFDYEDQPTDDDLDEYRLTEANTGFKIDIPLNKGNVYGLVGRNGIGKSTLLKRLKKQGGAHLLHQETMGCTQTVSEILKAPSNIFKGKKELLKTPVEKMSGGWIRRVFIERALQSDSAMILLDEPTNMLDMEGIAYLEDQIRRKRDKIFVIVSHDKEFLSNVCNFILFLSDEIKCYRGNYDTFVKNWTIERNEKIGRYKKEKANREHLQTFINRFRANASMAAQAQSKLKILAKMGPLEPIRDEI
ncbi:putative ATP-binding cassette sub-family F member 3 like protein, partial [Dictyocoela roeselum]